MALKGWNHLHGMLKRMQNLACRSPSGDTTDEGNHHPSSKAKYNGCVCVLWIEFTCCVSVYHIAIKDTGALPEKKKMAAGVNFSEQTLETTNVFAPLAWNSRLLSSWPVMENEPSVHHLILY